MPSIATPPSTRRDVDDPIERGVRLHGQALAALDDGDLDHALALAGEALAIFEAESGPTHPDVANVLNCIARIHVERADYAAAESCCRRASDIMREVRTLASGDDIDRLTVQCLTGLGDIRRMLGQYGDAEAPLQEAIAMGEAALGKDDEDVVTAVNSLAVLFKYSGRFDESAALYARALAATEAAGAGDDALATLLHNIGGLEHARGNFAAGEPAARRSVELRERALGPDHPAVAADLAALAAIVDGQGRHDDAEAMYVRALETFERVYGPDHYEVAVNLNNLAGVRHAQGRAGDAEALYRRALEIKERLLGADHPDVGLSLNNLGLLLDDAGRPQEAEAAFARALAIFEARLEVGHPKRVACASNYAALLRALGRDDEAAGIDGRSSGGNPIG
jgi:tetratricopeptide (TPR) repeat protein